MNVIVKLEPLSEQNGLLRFLRNEDHAGLLNGFVQDIANAVTDYQVCGEKNARFKVADNSSDISPTKHVREHQEYWPDHQGHR